ASGTTERADRRPSETREPGAMDSPGDDEAVTLPDGSRIHYFGDYELIRTLGTGGMGVVYKARQMTLNRPVALKMLRAGLLAGEDDLRRFRNETEAVALLDHPHIVPIYEVGQHQGRHYFTMRLIAGTRLVDRLDALAAAPRLAARLMVAVSQALHHAHQRG